LITAHNCNELGTAIAAQDSAYDLAFPRSSIAATYAQQDI